MVKNLDLLDLNLLRVFEAVFEDRNLQRASKRLHLSQSAVSHALARLREALQDELFVRTARGMEPTARAMDMASPLRASMRTIYETLGVTPFSATESRHQFVVAANDYVTHVLVSPLVRELASSARGIDLVVRPSTRLDLAEQIDVGRIDLAIGVFAEVPNRLRNQMVWAQKDVLVMRKSHPMRRRAPTIADLAHYSLVTVSLGGHEEGAIDGYILERGLARQSEMFDRKALESALAAQGLQPRYRVTVPHALAVPALLVDSDMLSIVPQPLAASFAASGDLIEKPLPYAAPTSILRALWHGRHQHDTAHIWLRDNLLEVAGRRN